MPVSLLLTLSGEIHTKSRRTSRWFRRVLRENLQANLDRFAPQATLVEDGARLLVEADEDDVAEAAHAARATMGVQRVDRVRAVPTHDIDAMTTAVAEIARGRVAGRTFAVRVHRRGEHPWGSPEAQSRIGAALLDDATGVDLDDPEVEVRVEVYGPAGYVVDRSWDGPAGVPLGTQARVLALQSGGFDSPVAAWMLMRRGAPVDFLHFTLECAASDHAMVVAHDLWRRWGAGSGPRLWKVDFQPVRDALLETTPSRLRQVVLKQMMFAAAGRLAERLGIDALVTGESVGQVSSQTIRHLAEIDRMTDRTVLRPLAGLTKDEIIGWSRRIGTADLSARAREVCDLSEGPVAVAARADTLDRAHADLPEDMIDRALATCEVVALPHWTPGGPMVPVVAAPPEGVPLLSADGPLPDRGPVCLRGIHAPERASELLAAGREVSVVDTRPTDPAPAPSPLTPGPAVRSATPA